MWSVITECVSLVEKITSTYYLDVLDDYQSRISGDDTDTVVVVKKVTRFPHTGVGDVTWVYGHLWLHNFVERFGGLGDVCGCKLYCSVAEGLELCQAIKH